MADQNTGPRGEDVTATEREGFFDIVFDGPPGPDGPRFIEVENEQGNSISIGDWVQRADGYWVLRVARDPQFLTPDNSTEQATPDV